MSRTSPIVDEMVREYLLFRGFTKTAQTLETEIKFDRDKNMRADKITDHLFSYVYGFELTGLRDYWNYLNKRFFRRISNTVIHSSLLKLENCLFKYYIVHAHQQQKHDKIVEFFEKMAGEITATNNKDTWREWFSFPYIKNPDYNPIFEPYFSPVWFDTFKVSLQNFISTVLDSVPLPALLQWNKNNRHEDSKELHQLQQEVATLKKKLQERRSLLPTKQEEPKSCLTRSDLDISEDFYIVSAGRSPDTGGCVPNNTLPGGKSGAFTILNPREYTEHTTSLTSAYFSCEGMFCCTSDSNGILKVWSFSPQIKTLHTFAFKSGVYCMHWSRKVDKLLYVGTGRSTVKIINIGQRKVNSEIVHPTEGLCIVCIASNLLNTILATSAANRAGETCEFIVWDCKTYRMLHTLEISPSPSPIRTAHFNHNGNLLVSGANDGMIRVYDMSDFQCIMGWQAHTSPILTARFSIDENTVFSYCEDGILSQWRLYPMSQSLHRLTINQNANRPKSLNSFSHRSYFTLDNEGKYILVAKGVQPVIYKLDGHDITEESVLPNQGSEIVSVDWHVPYSTRLCLVATTSGIARITELLV